MRIGCGRKKGSKNVESQASAIKALAKQGAAPAWAATMQDFACAAARQRARQRAAEPDKGNGANIMNRA